MPAESPAYVGGHGLLAGKTVVVTAAAGTGIGSAVARKAIEEGATVLISDFHERRLGETADRLAEETGTRPDTQVCNVTDEAQVQALVDAAVDRLGPPRRDDQQRRPRRVRRRRRHDRRAVVDRARRDPHRHLPLHPGRPQADVRARARVSS
jgi:NAD(P)-dependent dehydrogenase (short-subunit alcohol dehydrogenase family)